MRVQNINCEYIRILSSGYERLHNAESVKSVQIVGSVNGGENVTENINVDELFKTWNISFNFNTDTRITQLYLRNIFTKQSYPLLPEGSSYEVTSANLNTIKSLAATTILNTLGLSGITQTYTISDSVVTYKITNLPFYILASKISLTRGSGSTLSDKYFSFVDSNKYVLNGDDILITPQFFGSDSFIDGIYKFKISTIDDNDVIVQEETCYFMDCTLSASIINNINVDECLETDVDLVLLHYSLRVASNRECDCDDMQNIFNFLNTHLETSNTDPCGC